MRSKKIQLLIKIAIPVAIVVVGFEIYKIVSYKAAEAYNKPVVISEDASSDEAGSPIEVVSKQKYGNIEGFYENHGFTDNNEALISVGISREDFYKKYPNEFDKTNEEDLRLFDEAWHDIYGQLYRLNLDTLERTPLNIDTYNMFSDLIPNSNKFNYMNGNKYSVYDLKNNLNTPYRTVEHEDGKGEYANWSKDGNYLISCDNGSFNLYNVKNNYNTKVHVDNNDLHVYYYGGYYSEDGQNIYYIGIKDKDKNLKSYGIYKVNSSSGNITEVLSLPPYNGESGDSDNSIIPANFSVLDGGKRILFNATIDGKSGTYIYDVESKKFYNVIPHEVTDEGKYILDYPVFISPDKTKLVYVNRVEDNGEYKCNLYAANINGATLSSKTCLYENINLSGNPYKAVQWSGDSKKILFFSANKNIEKNYFSFKDVNEVNIITFK